MIYITDMQSLLIKISVVSFLVSVFIFEKFKIDFGYLFFILMILICIGLVIRNFKILKITLCILLFFILGFLRIQLVHPIVNEQSIHFYQDEEILREIEGVIIENPDRRREKANYIVETEKILINGNRKEVKGRVLFSMDLYPEFEYGDKVRIKGRLLNPPEFDTFSYKNYLSLFKVYSVIYYPRVELIDKSKASLFFSVLFGIKDSFESKLNQIIPEPMASFEAGLLTGSRKGIPDDLMVNFNLTGLTHIIAISGYNISLIIFLISSVFTKQPRNVKVPIIIGIIIVFTLFVGASAAVVRASIMGIISMFALWFGRQSQVLNALLLSAFVMTLFNPLTLIYDVGFQLSFLATLGLILTGNHIVKLFKFVPEVLGLREAFAMTFSAQIFALPVILYNFKRFSLISPVANVLVVPFIPFAMFFGFIAVICGYFSLGLGFILIFPAWLSLKYIVFVTDVLANLPLASFEVPWFSVLHLFGYFLFCFMFAYLIYPNFRNILFRT